MGAGLLACTLSGGAGATTETEAPTVTLTATQLAIGAPAGAFDTFLDRLMRAESDGRDNLRNGRSTALGAFQFIKSTFLEVMRRHYPGEIANMRETDILALRADRGFARRAAEAFSKENLDYLVHRGLKPTFGHLRLAFLLGPVGAARVIESPPSKRVADILGDGVIAANPFMRRMSAADLIARAHRDVGATEAPARQVAEAATAPQAAPPDAGAAQPAPRPEASRPEASQPEVRQPEVSRPEARQPEVRQPEVRRPKVSRPKVAAAGKAADRVVAAYRPERRRASSRTAAVNVTCNSRLASCQRWINLQVARLTKLADHTQASTRRDRSGA
jgi:hypothetical protein